MKSCHLIGIVAIAACAKQVLPVATTPAERPLVEVCYTPYKRQEPGPPGYHALTTGHLTVKLDADSAYGVPGARPTATVISGEIDLGNRTHTLDTRPLIGHRQNTTAWVWASTDSILVAIGPGGSHSSLWLIGKRGSADSAMGQWYGPGYGLDSGSFLLSGLGSAAPGRLIPACS